MTEFETQQVAERRPLEDFERIERFQALQSGQYWRALEDIQDKGITSDMVLLLQSIKWVEGRLTLSFCARTPLSTGPVSRFRSLSLMVLAGPST